MRKIPDKLSIPRSYGGLRATHRKAERENWLLKQLLAQQNGQHPLKTMKSGSFRQLAAGWNKEF
jgi:hypothetical protein